MLHEETGLLSVEQEEEVNRVLGLSDVTEEDASLFTSYRYTEFDWVSGMVCPIEENN